MSEIKELHVVNLEDYAMTPEKVQKQIYLIQEVMKKVMKEGEHYGIIPGCDKPSLLKPGAEKLSCTFHLAPSYTITKTSLPEGHREYEVMARLTLQGTDTFIGEGVGICSTMESKYRYRNVSDYEITGEDIPKDAKEKKAEYRKQGFGMKKVDGIWQWVKYKADSKVENPDIADTYNTVLKMAKKRAHVDAILTATAASDIFTQDAEDLGDVINAEVVTTKKNEPEPSEGSDFLGVMNAEQHRIGDTEFFKILGNHGFERPDQIENRQTQIAIYGELKKVKTKRSN